MTNWGLVTALRAHTGAIAAGTWTAPHPARFRQICKDARERQHTTKRSVDRLLPGVCDDDADGAQSLLQYLLPVLRIWGTNADSQQLVGAYGHHRFEEWDQPPVVQRPFDHHSACILTLVERRGHRQFLMSAPHRHRGLSSQGNRSRRGAYPRPNLKEGNSKEKPLAEY